MLYNILTNLAEKTRASNPGEAALYALLGFAVVFVGIAFLILVVWLVGLIMGKAQGIQVKSKKKESVKRVETVSDSRLTMETELAEAAKKANTASASAEDAELTDETIAVITAAIMAYYQKNNPKCEFTVKRIKRI